MRGKLPKDNPVDISLSKVWFRMPGREVMSVITIIIVAVWHAYSMWEAFRLNVSQNNRNQAQALAVSNKIVCYLKWQIQKSEDSNIRAAAILAECEKEVLK